MICFGYGAAGCTKPDPDSCCTSEAQCTSLGIAQLRPCDSARVCNADGACIAPQCTLDSDCTDPASPVCIDQQCTAKCVTDGDCTDPAAAKCDAAGACVACVDNAGCTMAEAPVCDGPAHSCRACTADADCDSGVCLEFSGECAATSRLLFVSETGTSNGECSSATPCRTIADAVALVTTAKDVIRVAGTVVTDTKTITDSTAAFTIDGSDATLTVPQSGSGGVAAFDTQGAGVIVIEGVTMTGNGNPTLIAHVESGQIHLHECSLLDAEFAVDGGIFEVSASVLTTPSLSQTGGKTVLDANTLTAAQLNGDGGAYLVTRNLFSGTGGALRVSGTITIENNVFTSADSLADEVGVSGSGTFRFNTLVNTSGVLGDGDPLECDGGVTVSSNIIAWNTMADNHCPGATYSLYDEATTVSGGHNQSRDVATFFVNLATSDFHLAAGSPALGHGDPGATDVTTDFDGHPRPDPAGSAPDVGAFESP